MPIHKDTRAYNAAQLAGDKRICDALAKAIDRGLPGAENKIWHRHPVWFLDGNPIVGYSKLKDCVRLLFWSGQSFDEPGLAPEGTFKAAETRYTSLAELDADDLQRWLEKSSAIQWDYKNIVKRKGKLEWLKRAGVAGGATSWSVATKKSAAATKSTKSEKSSKSAATDWRSEMLARVRRLIQQADPAVVEEVKWRKPSNPGGVPVWSHDGILCTGETYKSVVKLTFAKGASLPDPAGLFNSSLEGNTHRAIDLREGEKIDEAALRGLIREAVALNTSTKTGEKAKRAK